MSELFYYNKSPKIYAYTEPQFEHTLWQGEKQGKGLIKVGYTERTMAMRMKEHFPTNSPNQNQYTILFTEEAIDEQEHFFKDHLVHKRLEEKGFRRIKIKEPRHIKNTEWFECTKEDVLTAIIEVKAGRPIEGDRYLDFVMRPEQKQAVSNTISYFNDFSFKKRGQVPNFLWNAKMRFGKTFTSYKLAQQMGWKRIVVMTYKPAVAAAWKEDLMHHKDFEGWQFIDKNTDFDTVNIKKPFVWFISFQDITQTQKSGEIKERLKVAYRIKWDCVIVDEYHYGAWRNNAKDFYEGETAKEAGVDEKLEKDFNLDAVPITAKHRLYLSGTPFRALASGEFLEDQIFNWTYTDEQRAKKLWNVENGPNPYIMLPQMVMMTYQLPDHVKKIATTTDQNEFSLNEFFAAEKITKDGKDNYKFKHENEVQKWLDMLRGSEKIFKSNAGPDKTKPPLPYEDRKLKSYLNHTFWYMKGIASCFAMAELLEKDNFFNNGYDIHIAAGKKGGGGIDAFNNLMSKLGRGTETKSITLSCGKLTTGVTVKQWSGIFMLRDTTSPESYFQAAFRVQSPWAYRNADDTDEQAIEVAKPTCYIFDFSPNRALNLISQYGNTLDTGVASNNEQKIQEFLNFLPVLAFDGTTMESLDAGALLDISIVGVASSMLAKRWQSSQLIDITNMTLERVLDDQRVIDILEKIEDFRNLKNDIRKVITATSEINKLKKEKIEGIEEEKDKKIITEKEKEIKGIRKLLSDKLKKFLTRVPVFMYLTDYREETLKDVITNIEPDLFTKVTGLSVKDFEILCEVGLFNQVNIDQSVLAFKRYEEYSLNYAGGHELKPDAMVGGFETSVRRDEIDQVIEGLV